MPDYNRNDLECEKFKARGLPHYHVVALNDRIKSDGVVDHTGQFLFLGLKPADFEGRRVLDVGALDGVLSFQAEKCGAAEVLAIDVEDPEKQDWGYSGPADRFRNLGDIKRSVFEELHGFFGSNVLRQQKTVYDLGAESDGQFDIIFFYGVLYHLRHPLLAFDRLRAVAKGAICVETHIFNPEPMVPSSLFYLDDVLDDAASNWCGPSESCVASWMKDAGFKTIYAERDGRSETRRVFIGFVGEPTFSVNTGNFRRLDEAYFAEARKQVQSKLKWTSFPSKVRAAIRRTLGL